MNDMNRGFFSYIVQGAFLLLWQQSRIIGIKMSGIMSGILLSMIDIRVCGRTRLWGKLQKVEREGTSNTGGSLECIGV